MKRLLTSAMTFLFIAALGTGIASAKPCHDSHGRFVKCPKVVKHESMKRDTRCRDSHGRFIKCNPMHH
jgi:hypothetical protein